MLVGSDKIAVGDISPQKRVAHGSISHLGFDLQHQVVAAVQDDLSPFVLCGL